MRDDDSTPEQEDTLHILQRRRELRARSLGRWRRLLLAGAATGVAFGTLTCRAQVCLSQVARLECSSSGPSISVSNLSEVSAHWAESSPGSYVVFLTAELDASWIQDGHLLTFSGSPQAVDATLINGSVMDTSVTLECEPTAGASAVELILPMDCDGHASALHVLLDTSADPVDGAVIPVTELY